MSDRMRWRNGETNSVNAPVDSTTVIDVGDLIYLNEGKALPASSLKPEIESDEMQETFADQFLGVAMQKSVAGSSSPVRVATSGFFEFDAPSATYQLGNLVGVCNAEGESMLCNQKVTKVPFASYAIGRIARHEANNATLVLVAIHSTVMNGHCS